MGKGFSTCLRPAVLCRSACCLGCLCIQSLWFWHSAGEASWQFLPAVFAPCPPDPALHPQQELHDGTRRELSHLISLMHWCGSGGLAGSSAGTGTQQTVGGGGGSTAGAPQAQTDVGSMESWPCAPLHHPHLHPIRGSRCPISSLHSTGARWGSTRWSRMCQLWGSDSGSTELGQAGECCAGQCCSCCP